MKSRNTFSFFLAVGKSIFGFGVVGSMLLPTLMAAPLKEAKITRVVNQVDLIEGPSTRRNAQANDVMKDDMVLATGQSSRAELRFNDNTLARIGANSYFTFAEGTRNMELGKGTMLLKVPKDAGGAKISTQSVTAAITGTTVLLESNPGGEVVLKSGAPLPPTPEADEDLRRKGLGSYASGTTTMAMPAAWSQGNAPVAGGIRVAAVDGSVRAMRPGQTQSTPVAAGETLPVGSFIFTQAGSSATLHPVEGVATRVTAKTSVRINALESGPRVKPRVEFELQEGSVLSAIGRSKGDEVDYQIRTPQGVVAARGTVIGTTSRGGQTGVFGGHGNINFRSGGIDQNIKPGNFVTFTGSGSNVQIGSNVNPNSRAFQVMMSEVLVLVQQAADRGLVRSDLPGDVRGALQAAGIQVPAVVVPPMSTVGDPAAGEGGQGGDPGQGGGGLRVEGGNKPGFSKMIVLEGTMRVYLNDRIGESMLIEPGQMIILDPRSRNLPRPVNVDINRLIQSSNLVTGFEDNNDPNNPNGGGLVLNDPNVQQTLNQQERQIKSGKLSQTGLAISGNRLFPVNDFGKDPFDRRNNVENSRSGSAFLQKPVTAPGKLTIDAATKITGAPPVIMAGSKTVQGGIKPPGTLLSFLDFAFEGGARPIDNLLATLGVNEVDLTYAVFRAEDLEIVGDPTIEQGSVTTRQGTFQPEALALVGLNEVIIGNGLNVTGESGLGRPLEVVIASENAGIDINNASFTGLDNDWVFYARGGDLTMSGFNFESSGSTSFIAQNDIVAGAGTNLTGDSLDFTALVDVDLGAANIDTSHLQIEGRNITLPGTISSPGDFLEVQYTDTNGAALPFVFDPADFNFSNIDRFIGTFNGVDVNSDIDVSIDSATFAELWLATDGILSVIGVEHEVSGESGSALTLRGSQAVEILSAAEFDINSISGPSFLNVSSGLGSVTLEDLVQMDATGSSQGVINIFAGDAIVVGTAVGSGANLSAFGSDAGGIRLDAGAGLEVLGLSMLNANSNDKASISLVNRNSGDLVLGALANVQSSSFSSGSAEVVLDNKAGKVILDTDTGYGASLSASGADASFVDVLARTGIEIREGSSVSAQNISSSTQADLNLINTLSGDIIFEKNTSATAGVYNEGNANLLIKNDGGNIFIGNLAGGASFSASGGDETHVDLRAKNAINLLGNTSLVSTASGSTGGQATVLLESTGPGIIEVADEVSLTASSITNDSPKPTAVNIRNLDGSVVIGAATGLGTSISSSVLNSANDTTRSEINIQATQGIEIRSTSDIHAIMGALAKGSGRVQIINNGSGNIIIADGAEIEADDGSGATPDNKGIIFIDNMANNGVVQIGSPAGGATLTANRITAQALGTAGMVKVYAGSVLNASQQINLFANTGNGTVLFTGGGSVTLNSGDFINIGAHTVQIDAGTSVANNATIGTFIGATNKNYNGGGFGSFTNPVSD